MNGFCTWVVHLSHPRTCEKCQCPGNHGILIPSLGVDSSISIVKMLPADFPEAPVEDITLAIAREPEGWPHLHFTHEAPEAQREADFTEGHTASERPSTLESTPEAVPLCRGNLPLEPLSLPIPEQGACQTERRWPCRMSLRALTPGSEGRAASSFPRLTEVLCLPSHLSSPLLEHGSITHGFSRSWDCLGTRG